MGSSLDSVDQTYGRFKPDMPNVWVKNQNGVSNYPMAYQINVASHLSKFSWWSDPQPRAQAHPLLLAAPNSGSAPSPGAAPLRLALAPEPLLLFHSGPVSALQEDHITRSPARASGGWTGSSPRGRRSEPN